MLRNREIKQDKVQWKHFGPDEATGEMVDQMLPIHPCFLVEAKQFGICIYVYGCKYRHEICYKAPISSMAVMLSCVSHWFASQ